MEYRPYSPGDLFFFTCLCFVHTTLQIKKKFYPGPIVCFVSVEADMGGLLSFTLLLVASQTSTRIMHLSFCAQHAYVRTKLTCQCISVYDAVYVSDSCAFYICFTSRLLFPRGCLGYNILYFFSEHVFPYIYTLYSQNNYIYRSFNLVASNN